MRVHVLRGAARAGGSMRRCGGIRPGWRCRPAPSSTRPARLPLRCTRHLCMPEPNSHETVGYSIGYSRSAIVYHWFTHDERPVHGTSVPSDVVIPLGAEDVPLVPVRWDFAFSAARFGAGAAVQRFPECPCVKFTMCGPRGGGFTARALINAPSSVACAARTAHSYRTCGVAG